MVRTTTCWGTRNPTWVDEFSFVIEGPHESIRIFLLEERKRGVQKQLGEVLLTVAGLEQNQTVQNSYPVIGDKGVTVGELRIRATYAVDIILPTVDYNQLLALLILPEMTIVRNLAAVTKEKSVTARHLVHIYQARDMAEGFIRTIVKEEIERTDTIEVLFRGNTVCTKAMDHFMKLVGSLYQREVLMPIIEVITRETQSLEVQKEKLGNGDDWKRNLARLQKLTELLLQRIFQSVNHCPPPIRSLLRFIRDSASAKFPNAPNCKHTSVTSFIFLRFFVPAVLNPKHFGLTANMPSELHMRIFTLVAGVLQKLANLTRYREQELHINALNPFLDENFPKTRLFIDELVDVAPSSFKVMQRRMSIANSIQIDVHLAGLAREIEVCRAPLSALTDTDPLIPKLFDSLDTINKKLIAVKDQINQEELGLAGLSKSSGEGLDTLLSKVIQTEIKPAGNAKIVSVKRSAQQEEPLPEGATKARTRSGSIFSRSLKKIAGRKPSGSVASNSSSSSSSIKVSHTVPRAGTQQPGAAPPPTTPSSDFSRSPLNRSITSLDDNDSTSSSSSRPIRASQDLEMAPSRQHQHITSSAPLSSSLGAAPSGFLSSGPMTMPVRMMKTKSDETSGSAASPSFANGNLDIINQHRENMKLKAPSSNPPSFKVPSAPTTPTVSMASPSFPVRSLSPSTAETSSPRAVSSELWFGEGWGLSDLEAMEQQTDYHGLSAGMQSEARSGSDFSSSSQHHAAHSSGDSSDDDFPAMAPGSFGDAMSDSGGIPPTIEEEVEEEDLDEVLVVKMDLDITALEREFDALEKIISDIKALPTPPPPTRNPLELIPEINQLEKVVEELEEAVVFTTPKVHIGSDGLTCKFCLGAIDSGSRFLVVMGQNFHEGHLNCNICSRDLSEVAFQWYKEKSYCFDCYKKGHGIRPMCAACDEPIMTATYTQALGKYWHPDHFCCTVCKVGFPDGTFYNFEGKPYCPKHQNKGQALPNCGMCLMPIGDPNYIEALGQKWHSHHFCCDICGIQLVGQFVTYEKDNGATGKACESHFN